MLSQILKEFEARPEGLCLDELALNFGKDPSAIEGMLDLLVEMGRLVEIGDGYCQTCPARTLCTVIPPARRTFALADRQPEPRSNRADEPRLQD